jgi:hypothetical protein
MLFLVVWIGSLFFVVCCRLNRPKVVWCALALQRTKNDNVDGLVLMLFKFFEYGRLDKRKWRIALMMKGETRLLKRGNSSGRWATFVVCLFWADVLFTASGKCD